MEMSKIEAEIKKAVKAYKQEYARQLTDLDKMIEDILTGNQSFPDFLAGWKSALKAGTGIQSLDWN